MRLFSSYIKTLEEFKVLRNRQHQLCFEAGGSIN